MKTKSEEYDDNDKRKIAIIAMDKKINDYVIDKQSKEEYYNIVYDDVVNSFDKENIDKNIVLYIDDEIKIYIKNLIFNSKFCI
jgi:hypothetical protein